MNLDDPATTFARRRIVREKAGLRAIYEDWYRVLAAALPTGPGKILELGSGGGFFADTVPDVVRSDVFLCPGLDLVLDGRELPFSDGSLRAVAMTNVLHHLPQPLRFFDEAARCVRPGGVIAMIEPWNTPWSRFLYRRFHSEPFVPDAEDWEFTPSGPLTGANGALPWILLARDRDRFAEAQPMWRIRSVAPMMPLRYVLAGGISMRPLLPAAILAGLARIERSLPRLSRRFAMFAAVILERRADDARAAGQRSGG